MSHAPLFPVDVCVAASLFVQVTLSPTFTVTDCGWNAKFLIDTAALAALAPPAAARTSATEATIAANVK